MSTYVYGFVHDDESLDGMELSGVGEDAPPVRFARPRDRRGRQRRPPGPAGQKT